MARHAGRLVCGTADSLNGGRTSTTIGLKRNPGRAIVARINTASSDPRRAYPAIFCRFTWPAPALRDGWHRGRLGEHP